MAAAKVLKYGLGLRNPETFEAVGFAAGTKKSDLPDWAKALVQDDDFTSAEAESTDGDSTSGSGSGEAPAGYAGMKVADLKAEIEKRNADREDDAKLSTDGNKGDLVATLEADDAAQANPA